MKKLIGTFLVLMFPPCAFAQFHDDPPPNYQDFVKQYNDNQARQPWRDLAEAKTEQLHAETQYLDLMTLDKLESQRQYKGDITPELRLGTMNALRNAERKMNDYKEFKRRGW